MMYGPAPPSVDTERGWRAFVSIMALSRMRSRTQIKVPDFPRIVAPPEAGAKARKATLLADAKFDRRGASVEASREAGRMPSSQMVLIFAASLCKRVSWALAEARDEIVELNYRGWQPSRRDPCH